MRASRASVSVCVLVGLLASTSAHAVTIDTVLVGDAGNAGELSGAGAGGFGPDRISGAVGYTYNIGKYEVTAGQYAEFLNKVAGVDTYALYNPDMSNTSYGCGITRSGGGTIESPFAYSVADDFMNRPVNFVSYWDSCRFANWLSNGQPTGRQGAATTERGTYTLDGYGDVVGGTIQRNPGSKWAVTSEDEWYKAAYYQGGSTTAGYWDYPTRSDSLPGNDMTDASGNNANYYTGSGPYPIDSGKYTTVVGEFQNSAGPYGTFDQSGNVFEWNESVVYQDPTYAIRGLRGGSFLNSNVTYLRASDRTCDYPSSEYSYVGFRVVQLPEPATMVLLTLASVGIVRRKSV